MNLDRLLFAAFIKCLLIGFVLPSRGSVPDSASSPEHPNLTLTPLLLSATLNDGFGKLPFVIENKSSTGVMITPYWHAVVRLMTYDSDEEIPVKEFGPHSPSSEHGDSPPILLKPGTTGTFNAFYTIQAIDYLRSVNKRIYGDISGQVVGTNQTFKCSSAPFSPPQILTARPWTDLGEQNYFTVTSDTNNIGINPHKLVLGIWQSGAVNVPVSIKNTSGQSYVAVALPGIYIERKGKNPSPSHWAAIKASKPILKPGESIVSGCDIDLDWLESEGYKAGDKLVAAVDGRVPNTNQVFECYSAPFELPPLPKDKPPKGALRIPGL